MDFNRNPEGDAEKCVGPFMDAINCDSYGMTLPNLGHFTYLRNTISRPQFDCVQPRGRRGQQPDPDRDLGC